MPNPVPNYIDPILYPIEGNRMIELGRKKTKIDGEWITYKNFFEKWGMDHVSIDIQGGYGSLALDLTKPIEIDPADIVTNFGTTEHVRDQAACWRNVNSMVKVGGVLASMTPLPGDWWWHGDYYPTPEFYVQFALMNGYVVEYLAISREEPFRNIQVRMRKVEEKNFVFPNNDVIYVNQKRLRGW